MDGSGTSESRASAEERAPAAHTIERWCLDFVRGASATEKLSPSPTPDTALESAWDPAASACRIAQPGRPPEWTITTRSGSTPRGQALRDPAARAKLLHRFVHHELQAAELFAWAVLAFPETPRAFRTGLVRLCREELAHLELYLNHMRALGFDFGAEPVRDWFWERVPTCVDAAAFVALQGIGLEGANLEHSARFALQFRAAGDEAGARILERVERDEIAHVAFARQWFERFTGRPLTFDAWCAHLPAPLTPSVLQGRPINRAARLAAGLDDAFLDKLSAAPPTGLRRSE
ncbi:MAG: DUF455 family protein [Planctomycetes bacterium]|nr:DUF455 family protein [Planctomycetota bacterium]